jgi:hypothetical protein
MNALSRFGSAEAPHSDSEFKVKTTTHPIVFLLVLEADALSGKPLHARRATTIKREPARSKGLAGFLLSGWRANNPFIFASTT